MTSIATDPFLDNLWFIIMNPEGLTTGTTPCKVRVEIALGRSEMEVPVELWLSAEGV